MAEVPEEWIEGTVYGPGEVAVLFNVSIRTLTRWSQKGIIGYFRTPSGARRYPESEVARVAKGEPAPDFLKELADEDNERWHSAWEQGWRRNRRIWGDVIGAPDGEPGQVGDGDAA